MNADGDRDGLTTALRCLAHPASLFALAVLLINDHLLKGLGPDWLTGKLSDFAGLFFFPFVLAALVALVPGFRCARRTGWVSVGVTAVWFVLMKTTALGNALTVGLASTLVGPSSIVLDPTDLFALVALVPASRLWTQTASAPTERLRFGLVHGPVLFVALLGTLATSVSDERVQRLGVEDDQVVAYTSHGGVRTVEVYTRVDGTTWDRIEGTTPEPRPADLVEPNLAPVQSPVAPGTWFRLEHHRVMRSDDDRRTWVVDWEVPPAREGFAQRSTSAPVDIGPYDLMFVPDGGGSLLVAMGSGGVGARDAEGKWTLQRVGAAQPHKFEEHNVGALLVNGLTIWAGHWLAPALTIWVLGSALMGGIVVWRARRRLDGVPIAHVFGPTALWLATFSGAVLARIADGPATGAHVVMGLASAAALILAPIWTGMSWSKFEPDGGRIVPLRNLCAAVAGLAALVGLLIVMAWGAGFMVAYASVWIWTGGVCLVLLVWLGLRATRFAR